MKRSAMATRIRPTNLPRPVQYKVACILFAAVTALAVLIGAHHLFWSLMMTTPAAAEIDFAAPMVLGHANVTLPLFAVLALAARALWSLVQE